MAGAAGAYLPQLGGDLGLGRRSKPGLLGQKGVVVQLVPWGLTMQLWGSKAVRLGSCGAQLF